MLEEQLKQSYEQLIASGCDRRLFPNADGLNSYGTSVLPQSALAFGSCTCSSPSHRATKAAGTMLEQIRNAADPDDTAASIAKTIRHAIKGSFDLPSNVDVALTPSGTDVELLALALVAAGNSRDIVNIVVGPAEVGSGTAKAAAARHFDAQLPSGQQAVVGEPVDQQLASRVSVRSIDVRDERGQSYRISQIDAAVSAVVAEVVSSGAIALVHLVAHTKTGIHAPSLDLLRRLSNSMMDDVAIVVDAAQGRIAPSAYRYALDQGWLVSFTGSKFFGGPAFAGALLIPAQYQPKERGFETLPKGLESYFGRETYPETWVEIREHYGNQVNISSLLRWTAAIAEIEAYFAIPKFTRKQIASAFQLSVCTAFDANDVVQQVANVNLDQAAGHLEPINAVPTVYSFLMNDASGNRLSKSQLKTVHRRLNASSKAEPAFHLGQPVMIGEQLAAIRIALGASLVVDVATDQTLGHDLDSRMNWLDQNVHSLSDRMRELAAENTAVKVG